MDAATVVDASHRGVAISEGSWEVGGPDVGSGGGERMLTRPQRYVRNLAMSMLE